MDNLTNLLLGFQIGFLFTAALFSYRIMRMATTPSFPYILAIVALTLMAFWRVNIIFNLLNGLVVTLGTTIIAILWMVFFVRVYTLIGYKNV